MRTYCLKRSLALIPTLFVISVILFTLVKMMPGDPVAMMMDPHTKPELYAASYAVKKEELGYNDTLAVQYIRYMEHLLKGEYGYSSSYQRPVSDVVTKPLMNTIMLNGIVFVLSCLMSLTIGVYCAVKKDGYVDRLMQYVSIASISLPSFLLGAALLYLFAFSLHLIPIGTVSSSSLMDKAVHMVLPVLTLTLLLSGNWLRYVRNAMIQALSADYILALRSRGIHRRRIVGVHALRNAMLPIMHVTVMELPNLISGSLLIEVLFSYNGIGSVMIHALMMRDCYLILSLNLLYSLLYVLSSFTMDLLSAYLDPRIRLDKHG